MPSRRYYIDRSLIPSRTDYDAMTTRSRSRTAGKTINLALQGGGSHGAFAWGVVDRLLEDGRLAIEGIVGTSAGAVNAAVLAYGLTVGGRQGARAKLAEFWKALSKAACFLPQPPSGFDARSVFGGIGLLPGYWLMDTLLRFFSPYELNPLNFNPMRDVLSRTVDFPALRNGRRVKLFTCASNVLTGRIRVFAGREATVDTVLASACLPLYFQAVEIEGEHYWDGGYMGNPPVFPLIYNCRSPDVVLVLINPVVIEEVPREARAIADRINTLSFNSSLMREMRAIHFVTKLVEHGFDDDGRLKRMHIHCVDAEDKMRALGASSKTNLGWDFLMHLYELGRERGEAFLDTHYDKIGRESSAPIAERFL